MQSSTSITAVSPAGTGTVGVTVTTPYGTTTAGAHEQFSYIHTGVVPVVKKLSAKKGPAAGGTLVTITGSTFTGATEVLFGQTPAAEFEVQSDQSISVTSPPGTSGTAEVTVVNQFGPSAPVSGDHFKYEKPTISSISPANGPKAGGTSLTITGSGYAPGEGITGFAFGKALATDVDCPSTSECTLLTPASTKAATVKVKALVGTNKSTAKEAAARYGYQYGPARKVRARVGPAPRPSASARPGRGGRSRSAASGRRRSGRCRSSPAPSGRTGPGACRP